VPATFRRLAIPEIILIEPVVFADSRGFFLETYRESVFVAAGIPDRFVQDNHSHSVHGVLRGLHYQRDPAAQGKLVQAVRGEIWDVAADIRRGSPTYGGWVSARLSDQNHHLLYIPPGFAHGFCVLSGEADVLYKVTSEYSQEHDRGIRWNDPAFGIEWPLSDPLLSAKDAGLPPLHLTDNNFQYVPR